jgi:tetratricopeptide (TPR) repeat protein
MRIRPLLLLIFVLNTNFIRSQSHKLDSVRVQINTAKDDRSKLPSLKLMSYYQSVIANLDSAIYFGEQGVEIATKLNLKKDLVDLYGNLGSVYSDKGKQPRALELFLKSLRLAEEIGDKRSVADNYVRMGALFDEQSNYDKSLKNYYTALPIYKKLNDKERVSIVIGNIGNIYYGKKQFTQALELYLQAIKIDEELDNKSNLKYSLGYIGMVCAELSKTIPVKRDSFHLVAITYYKRALDLAERMHDPQLIINWVGNLGIVYADMKNYKEAEKSLLRAVNLADSFNLPQEKIQFENGISELYYFMGDYKRSIDHYKIYTREKDSMFTVEKNNELTKHEMNFEFNKKMAAIRSAQEKKEAETEAKARQQKLIIYFVIAGLLVVAVFAGFIFHQLRITRGQKKIIEHQKKLVDEHREEMLASIHYAKRIQSAHLPSEKYIDRKLKELR